MAYATKFTFDCVWRSFEEMQKRVAAGDFSMLPEVSRPSLMVRVASYADVHVCMGDYGEGDFSRLLRKLRPPKTKT